MDYITHSLEETRNIVSSLLPSLVGGDILLLQGDLGTGKTAFTKLLGNELGILDDITSPTFAIMNIYPLPSPQQGISQLVHVDAYRMESIDEVYDIGLDEYMNAPDTLLCIEWPERIADALKDKKSIFLHFFLQEDGSRKITLA